MKAQTEKNVAVVKRACGECQLCCKLLPVRDGAVIDGFNVPRFLKHAGVRCEHQRAGKGCAIYPNRPHSCRIFECGWLQDPETTRDLRRPDRSHYVIDPTPDFITITYEHKGPVQIPVVQVWCDPGYRDAHKDPALRRLLAEVGEKSGFATIIRYGSSDAIVLFPPCMNDGEWGEKRSNIGPEAEHSVQKIAEVIGATVEVR